MNLARTWRTVRHLRPVQLWGRLAFRLRRVRPDLRAAPPWRLPVTAWVEGATHPQRQFGPSTFRFLNIERSVASEGDWQRRGWGHLWLYNLHYFEDLNAEGADQRYQWHRSLMHRWVAENPPGEGVGWEPYPLSLRIVHWIKWLLRQGSVEPVLSQSLAVQTRYLSQRLEHHLLGNHLFENAKALVFAGCFFTGDEAEVWRRHGLGLLAREIPEQILEDGGHFERSPMYHALILEDLFDLINVLRTFGFEVPVDWTTRAQTMLDWLDALGHPDGEIALFNDAAFDIAARPGALAEYAVRLSLPRVESASWPGPVGCRYLADSGYAALRTARAALIVDMAPLGPDYLPAHGHADSLTFEMSLFGHRCVVDSGTSVYAAGPARTQERSTRAHNTVIVDGVDSSEVYAAFRVGRRARILAPACGVDETCGWAEARHDGYTHLAGAPLHRRRWVLSPGCLQIIDWIDGVGRHDVEVRTHIHPDWEVSNDTASGVSLVHAGRTVTVDWQGAGPVHCEDYEYHPGFGRCIPGRVLVVRQTATLPRRMAMTLTWTDDRADS